MAGVNDVLMRIAEIQARFHIEKPNTFKSVQEMQDKEQFSSVLNGVMQKQTGNNLQEKQYLAMIETTAARYGVEPALVKAVARAESGFDPKAISPAGAKGIMQLMPGTAQKMGVTNIFDPQQNIAGGVKYLKTMLNQFNGDINLALAAYNAGPGNVSRYGGVPPFKETQAYVKTVQDYYKTYQR